MAFFSILTSDPAFGGADSYIFNFYLANLRLSGSRIKNYNACWALSIFFPSFYDDIKNQENRGQADSQSQEDLDRWTAFIIGTLEAP